MNVPRIDAWSLHCLTVFVRELSVTRAGAALGLSQPAASAILGKLRTVFGDPLLVKSSTGMVPTPRALLLRERGELMLQEMRAMVDSSVDVDPSTFEGSVALATVDTLRALLLPTFLRLLAEEAPRLAVRVHDVNRTRIHEQMENGTVDLGVGSSRVSTGRLHYRQLWVDRPMLMAGRTTFEGELTWDAEQLCRHPNAVVRTGRLAFYDDEIDKALDAVGLTRPVKVVEKSYLVLPLLLESSGLVSVVPARIGEYAVRQHAVSLRECPVLLPEMSVGMYWHERTHKDSMYQWVRGRLAMCAALC